MPATAFGDIHVVFGSKPPTLILYDKAGSAISGYFNPELAEATLETVFDAQNYSNVSGDICARRTRGEYLRATFQWIPKDSGTGQTIGDALKAATVPGEGWTFTITGMHVIKAGDFNDAFNYDASTAPSYWFIESGSLRGSAQEPAGLTFTGVRIKSLTSKTPVNEAT